MTNELTNFDWDALLPYIEEIKIYNHIPDYTRDVPDDRVEVLIAIPLDLKMDMELVESLFYNYTFEEDGTRTPRFRGTIKNKSLEDYIRRNRHIFSARNKMWFEEAGPCDHGMGKIKSIFLVDETYEITLGNLELLPNKKLLE